MTKASWRLRARGERRRRGRDRRSTVFTCGSRSARRSADLGVEHLARPLREHEVLLARAARAGSRRRRSRPRRRSCRRGSAPSRASRLRRARARRHARRARRRAPRSPPDVDLEEREVPRPRPSAARGRAAPPATDQRRAPRRHGGGGGCRGRDAQRRERERRAAPRGAAARETRERARAPQPQPTMRVHAVRAVELLVERGVDDVEAAHPQRARTAPSATARGARRARSGCAAT